MKLRDAEKLSLPTVRMKNARIDTDKAYRNIVKHLEYTILINRITPEFTTLVSQLNIIIIRYKNVLAHKAGKHNKNVEEGDANS